MQLLVRRPTGRIGGSDSSVPGAIEQRQAATMMMGCGGRCSRFRAVRWRRIARRLFGGGNNEDGGSGDDDSNNKTRNEGKAQTNSAALFFLARFSSVSG